MRAPFSLLLLFAIGHCIFSSAQPALHFFSDTSQIGAHNHAYATARENEFIYVGGQSFDYAYTPSVVKMDTAGNTLWTYTLNKEIDEQYPNGGTAYAKGMIRKILVDETGVYAHFGRTTYESNEIWKLDKMTGNIIWKRTVLVPISMAIANSNELAITYNNTGFEYDLINKATGKLVLTRFLGPVINNPDHTSLAFDTDGTAYISRDDTITKYSSANLNTVVWRKQVIEEGYVTSIALKDTSIYYFGNRVLIFSHQFIAGRAGKSTGNITWLCKPNPNSYFLDEIVTSTQITNDYVYASSVHTLIGSIFTGYHIWKVNRHTGEYIWDKTFHPLWGSGHGDPGSPYAGGLSLDIDPNGNIYVTGYENESTNSTSEWGICKFNSNGNLVYHQRIFDGAPFNSNHTQGVLAFFYNNHMYYLGDLQKSSASAETYIYLLATDTGSVFAPYRFKRTTAAWQETSAVKKILPFSANKYVVFSQLGAGIRIEMKSARNGDVVWQKDIRRGAYLTADKMVITADQKILMSWLKHPRYEMAFDYKNQPDSIYFIKMDSLGTITFDKGHASSAMVHFNPLQFYASGDSNNVYVYAMKDAYNNENSIHFFNIDKSTQPLGTFSNYIASFLPPLQGRQDLVIQKTRDTAIHFSGGTYREYKFDQAYGTTSGWFPVVAKSTGQSVSVQNVTRLNTSVIFSGKRSNAPNNYQISRYMPGQTGVLWNVTRSTRQTVEGISASDNSVYWTGKDSNNLILGRLDSTNGSTRWEKVIAPIAANQFYIPLDQQYNPVRNEYTICGFIEDRTNITYTQQAFYITTDTLGNIVRQWSQSGDYNKNNQLNTIAISPMGQTLIGGALYKIPYGRSAVLIEADTVAKVIVTPETLSISASPSSNVCNGDTVTLTASSPGCVDCTYQWNDLLHTTGSRLKVTLAGVYQVTVTNNAGSLTASQTVMIRPAPPKPVITPEGSSLKSSASAGNRWYLNGILITGATGQYLSPVTTGTYKVQVTENGCSSPMSDGFAFTITAIIDPAYFAGQVQIVPNPVHDRIIMNNKLNHPVYVNLYDITGRLLMTTRVPLNSTRELKVSHLNNGIYMVLVTDLQSKKSMQKTILKE
jgi:hypothetical protein